MCERFERVLHARAVRQGDLVVEFGPRTGGEGWARGFWLCGGWGAGGCDEAVGISEGAMKVPEEREDGVV